MGSSSPGTTPIRDFESLIPQCFYSYVFLFARLFLIIALSTMAGIVGSLLGNMTKAGEPPVTSLVAIMIVTTASLLWCLSSWSGYSRRHFPYKVTIVTDLLFLLPFGVFSVLLGLPIHDGSTKCPRVKPKDGFTIQAGPLGVLDFSGEPNGRVSCTKLYLLWVLMLIVCASFVLSAASVGVITSQETQFNKALWCARAMGGPVGSGDYHRGSSQIARAGLEEVVVAGSERQLQPRPRVHVSTRSLTPGEVSDDDDRRDGDTSYQSKTFRDPYRVNMTDRHGPRASRYDCTPRVDSSLSYGYGTSQGRSLGNPVLQGGNGKGRGGGGGAWTSSSREGATDQNPKRNQQQQQQYRAAGLANNRELTTKPPPKPIPIPVLQARSAALDQLEGRSSASIDLADAPYYRDLYTYFAQPDPPDPDPDPDRDSWATFTNTDRYNPQVQTQRKWKKKQRPSGFLFLPNSNIAASSPTLLHPDPDPDPAPPRVESHPYSNTPNRPSQAQTRGQGHGHDSYTSSVYSSPSIYDDTRFDHRDLPSPNYGLCHPPPRSSSGAAGVKYSLPPRPRTTLRLVDKETLNRLEGITEEEGGSGSRDLDGDANEDGDAVIELEEIPISPLPPAGRAPGRQIEGRTEGWMEWQQREPEQERGWEREQDPEVRETRGAGENHTSSGARITRWPGVWGIVGGSGHGRHEEEEDGRSSKHHRRGGFRARSTRLFSTVGAWLNGIDDGKIYDGTRHRDGYGPRSGHGNNGGHQWDMV